MPDVPESGTLGIAWGGLRGHVPATTQRFILAGPQTMDDNPIASHQLVQVKLVWLISEITKAQLLALQVGP